MSAGAQPPAFLLIYREPLKPGREASYRKIETETAQLAVRLGCPHPYLAPESLDWLKEIWWLNGFDSLDDQKRVGQAYAANAPWMKALNRNVVRKSKLTLPTIGETTRYRQDPSRGSRWTLGEGRFLVIGISHGEPRTTGTVFEADDGARVVIRSAKSSNEARALARSAGSEARVFAVRPDISFASQEWSARDPSFWRGRAKTTAK